MFTQTSKPRLWSFHLWPQGLLWEDTKSEVNKKCLGDVSRRRTDGDINFALTLWGLIFSDLRNILMWLQEALPAYEAVSV